MKKGWRAFRGFWKTLGYHNHHMEFTRLGSARAYDLQLKHTDPELVRIELDVGWAKAGGVEPHDYLAQYPGRFVSCHLEDFAPDRPPADLSGAPIPNMSHMAPGDGVVDFAKVLAEMDRQEQPEVRSKHNGELVIEPRRHTGATPGRILFGRRHR